MLRGQNTVRFVADPECDFQSWLIIEYDIEFDWDEKDRIAAIRSWNQYARLDETQRARVSNQMVSAIKGDFEKLGLSILDENVEREIDKVSLELHSNLGEVKEYEFSTVTEAIEFLNLADLI